MHGLECGRGRGSMRARSWLLGASAALAVACGGSDSLLLGPTVDGGHEGDGANGAKGASDASAKGDASTQKDSAVSDAGPATRGDAGGGDAAASSDSGTRVADATAEGSPGNRDASRARAGDGASPQAPDALPAP